MDVASYVRGCYWPYRPDDNPGASFACGRCPNCLKRRVDGWAYRLKYHMRTVKHAYFLTLTYADGQCKRSDNGFLNLCPDDFRKYIKRIRKRLGDNKHTPFNDRVKYVVTGEYGSRRGRPHYHAIVFNVPFEVLMKEWPHGIVDVRDVNSSRIAYVFKYTQKARIRKLTHDRDDRIPEYINYSQGLGKQFLTPLNILYHVVNIDNPTITLETGERIAIPRYYKEKMFTKDQRDYIAQRMIEISDFPDAMLTPDEQQLVLAYKNEKVRIMNKKAKKDKL